MTVGFFTIETSDATDGDYLNAYDKACHALLGFLRERIPPWQKSPRDSSVTLEKSGVFYTFRLSTPMSSKEIKAIALETAKLEQFHILKRPMNFGLVP